MIIKTRKKSTELLVFESLNNRMKLEEKDRLHFYNLRKGFEGEVLFDRYLERVGCDCLIVNDLLLKMNQTTFQLDSMMITSDCIYVFEVKNFEGEYYYDPASDQLFPKTRNVDVVNPLVQLMRSDTLLRQLFESIGLRFPIKSTVVFVNPQFTLYQAPMDKPFILPTQIERFIKQLSAKPSRMTNKHRAVAEKLISLHMSESPFQQIPKFEYDQLRKGIPCGACGSFNVTVEGRSYVCMECGHRESVTSAVLRCVGEFRLLFPGEKVTTSQVYDWCGGVVESRKRVQRILESNLSAEGKKRGKLYK